MKSRAKLAKSHQKKTYLILALLLALGFSAFYVSKYGFLTGDVTSAHVYGKPELSIEQIQLDVFYAIPNDKEQYNKSILEEKLDILLPKIESFHKNQFGKRSVISYRVFPAPVVLFDTGFFYDTSDTRFGNPEALKAITLELESRVYDKQGDLYNEQFITPAGHYRVIAIIYEGVGASGTEGSILLSRDFISKDEYTQVGASLFYHEFGHAIGIPEGYDIYTNNPFTNDIMGSGRRAPIENNYIDQSTLKEMGVF